MMLELYVIACLGDFCRDHKLGEISRANSHQCLQESIKRYMTQKHTAFPDYVIKKSGCRKLPSYRKVKGKS